jgi:hypothetical protein
MRTLILIALIALAFWCAESHRPPRNLALKPAELSEYEFAWAVSNPGEPIPGHRMAMYHHLR